MSTQVKTKGNYTGQIVTWVLLGLLFIFIGLVVFVGNSDYIFNGPKDFYDLEARNGIEKGEYVSIPVDGVVDWYAETQHKINGFIPAGSEQHCLIWVDDYTFISMTVKGKNNIEKVDKIIDETWDYLSGSASYLPSPVTFEGQLSTIDPEVEKFYKDALSQMGILYDSDYTIYYLTIDTTQTKGMLFLIIGFCLVMVIASVIGIASAAKGIKNLKQAGAASFNPGNMNAGINMPYNGSDMNAGSSMPYPPNGPNDPNNNFGG